MKILFILLSLVLGLTGCVVVPLSAESIDSQVVDADTGTPIEGAVIVAYWQLRPGSETDHSSSCGTTKVEEAVTDSDGRFHLASWGPTLPGCGGALHGGDPLMYVFKSGYRSGHYTNGLTNINTTAVTGSDWDKRQMKLKKVSEAELADKSSAGYYADFDRLNDDIDRFVVYMPDECNWQKIPNMLRELELERHKVGKVLGHEISSVTTELVLQDQWFQKTAPQCGSPKSFIEGLLRE